MLGGIMTLIPFTVQLGTKDEEIDARTTVERIRKHFPNSEVDWNRGDAEVHRGIDQLREMGIPDILIEGKSQSLGQVAYVSIRHEQFPGFTGWFYASHIKRDLGDCFNLDSDPETDIPFLKHLAAEIASKIDFEYGFTTYSTWGIDMNSVPQRSDPFEFARDQLPEEHYGELALRPLEEWKASLTRAVPLWFEQATATGKSKQEMIDRLGSVDAVAVGTVDALVDIGEVVSAWLVDISAPFHNGLILEHEDWMSYVSLSGAPQGILA
jgi:hypothetical protein